MKLVEEFVVLMLPIDGVTATVFDLPISILNVAQNMRSCVEDEDKEGETGSGPSSSSVETKLEKTFHLLSTSWDKDQLIVWSLAQNI